MKTLLLHITILAPEVKAVMFFALAVACYSLIWKLFHHYSTSIFSKMNPQWWNPQISWENKYKKDKDGDLIPYNNEGGFFKRLYYRIFNLKYLELFFTSATLNVWVTDAHHFFQEIMIIFFCLSSQSFAGISFINWYLVTRITWAIVFNLTYSYLYVKRD